MEKQEKLLKKIDKLLARYGVEDEEARKNFLDDLSKYNGEEEEKVDEETSQETEKVEEEKVETEEEQTKADEKSEEETKPIEEETKETETEEVKKEETQEQPQVEEEVKVAEESEEKTETETEKVVDDFSGKFEEYSKTLEALSSRIASIEDIVAKLGVPESPVGVEPNAQAKVQGENDAFDYFVQKRIG